MHLKPSKSVNVDLFFFFANEFIFISIFLLKDSKREESLVSHLLRQSQFERRLAVELLQTRHEKDVLRQNRIAYEKQLEIRRRQDFIEAMDREAVSSIHLEKFHRRIFFV